MTTLVDDTVVEMLTPEKFELYWPSISKQLDYIPHVWSIWWTKDYIRQMVMQGLWQCWGVGDGMAITVVTFTQIVNFPANKVFQVILAFGEGIDKALPTLVASYEKFASGMGCTMAEVTGRPGWEAKLRAHGFRRQTVILTRTVEQVRMN